MPTWGASVVVGGAGRWHRRVKLAATAPAWRHCWRDQSRGRGEIERWLDIAVGGGEVSKKAVLEADPTGALRSMCALLLRKVRLHAIAALRANETCNVHSLAV